jgi:hypothetical protein
MPDDLVPILAKDEEKQRAIREKANKDASSTQARAIGATAPANASRGTQVAAAKITVGTGRGALAPAAKTATTNAAPSQSAALVQKAAATAKPATTSAAVKSTAGKPSINMVIQAIPPFKGASAKPRQPSGPAPGAAPPAPANGKVTVNTSGLSASSSNNAANAPPMSPATAANNRLNVNASSFRPNPKANAFTPVTLLFFHADG